jgi:hypothetical protein
MEHSGVSIIVSTALHWASAILGILKKKNLLPPQGFEPPIIQSIAQSLYHIDIKSKLKLYVQGVFFPPV